MMKGSMVVRGRDVDEGGTRSVMMRREIALYLSSIESLSDVCRL